MSALKGAFEVSAENPVTSILDSQRFADWFISQVGRSQLIQTLEGHSDVVFGAAAHPTRELVVTGGSDKDLKSIRVWETQPNAACAPSSQSGPPVAAPAPPPPAAAPAPSQPPASTMA